MQTNRWNKVTHSLLLATFISVTHFTPIKAAETLPTIDELKQRSFLDDYYSNVLFGYNIVNNTQKYAARYVGNKLNCKHCHLQSGTVQNALPPECCWSLSKMAR
ncbi:MAG: hypothetical protein HON94_14410 [Methylococcales bacterium]|jgi:cytochrome c|nr:hypothetical protein [Methylococcales bacterium]MBT7408294.1 hypothetical protein [Methylococcales bacterium]